MNEDRPLYSVVIVVYNGVKTIQRAIDSVVGQNYSDYELVVVDGGSTDGTINILSNYRSQISTLIVEPDNGIYDAMNKAIRVSKGRYVYFLGSDDAIYDSNVLSDCSRSILQDEPDLLYGNVLMSESRMKYNGKFDYAKLLAQNISHQAIFYNITVFDRLGGFNLRYKRHADWDFNLKLFEDNTYKLVFFDRLIAIFQQGSTSSQHDVPFIRNVLLQKFLKYWVSFSQPFKNIERFDYLWRLVRNGQISSLEQLIQPIEFAETVKTIIDFQRAIGQPGVQNGFISKACMTVCYTVCLSTRKL